VQPGWRSRDSAAGWAVVESAAAAAGGRFAARLRSVYALGSLAHGGFCPLVSDVDVAIVLTELRDDPSPDPDSGPDRRQVASLVAGIRQSEAPLAERLSVFWGTQDSIAGRAGGGRFPAHDRLDLLRHGILVAGDEIRGPLPEPSYAELVAGTAAFASTVLAQPDRLREITDAAYAAALGPRQASKVALFPVRFLYTVRTGQLGRNDDSVRHYLARSPDGPAADLARAGMRWRTQWSRGDRRDAVRLLASGAVRLYQEFAGEYAGTLSGMDRPRLAEELSSWAATLALSPRTHVAGAETTAPATAVQCSARHWASYRVLSIIHSSRSPLSAGEKFRPLAAGTAATPETCTPMTFQYGWVACW
jgi:hypothetical protein